MQFGFELAYRSVYHGNLSLKKLVGRVRQTAGLQATETIAVSIKPSLDVLRRNPRCWLFACVHQLSILKTLVSGTRIHRHDIQQVDRVISIRISDYHV